MHVDDSTNLMGTERGKYVSMINYLIMLLASNSVLSKT